MKVQLYIRDVCGRTTCIEEEENVTVHTLKERIGENQRIPSELQILTCNGKLLNNNKTLFDYGITNECTIDLSAKLVGGVMGVTGRNIFGGFRTFMNEMTQFYNPLVGLSWWFFPVALNVYGIYKFRNGSYWDNKSVTDASRITGEGGGGGGGH